MALRTRSAALDGPGPIMVFCGTLIGDSRDFGGGIVTQDILTNGLMDSAGKERCEAKQGECLCLHVMMPVYEHNTWKERGVGGAGNKCDKMTGCEHWRQRMGCTMHNLVKWQSLLRSSRKMY